MTRPLVKRFTQGLGRDFVVGDCHGEMVLLQKALDAVSFDYAKDRLFSVGDLGDRGPFSDATLELMQEPWFEAVLGNHEQMMLDIYADGSANVAALEWHAARNGAAWWLTVPRDRQEQYLAAYAQMPLAIELETPRGTVGLIHAEVPQGMDWPNFIQRIESGCPHTTESALWGRSRLKRNDTSGVPGIGRVYAGHTIQHGQARRLGNCYYLDTGAFAHSQGGALTMAQATFKTVVLNTPRKLSCINLHETPGTAPFGQYADAPALMG